MTDFKCDTDGDLQISDQGDLVPTESTRQHQKSIIWAYKGHWKHAPHLGVGLQGYLNESGSMNRLGSSIRQELERDGMVVDSVEIKAGSLVINAEYPS